MTPELSAALAKLLTGGASGSVLPLAAKWDKAGALKAETAKLSGSLLTAVADPKAEDTARLGAVQSLIGLRGSDAAILPALVKQLAADGTPAFKRGLIAALGETDDASVGTALSAAYAKLPDDVQAPAFDTLLKRADWTLAFLDAVKANSVDVTKLGPAATARLRTIPTRAWPNAPPKCSPSQTRSRRRRRTRSPNCCPSSRAKATLRKAGRFSPGLRDVPQARRHRRGPRPRAHRHGRARRGRTARRHRGSERRGGTDLLRVESRNEKRPAFSPASSPRKTRRPSRSRASPACRR